MRRLVSLFLFLKVLISTGQEQPLGSWYMFNGFYEFSPKTELFVETQLRTWEFASNPQNVLLKPYLNFNLKPGFQIGFSQEYHYSWTYDEVKSNRNTFEEYRIGLQSIFKHKMFSKIDIQHRVRYEFRFLDEKGKQRSRYRLQFTFPFNKQSLKKGYFFSTLGNEFMLNFQPNIEIDQNRLYGMLGYQISEQLNFQLGYMHLSYPEQQNLNRIMLFLTHKLKVYKDN